MQKVRVALIGLGNVGKAFLQLMTEKETLLQKQYGLSLVLTAVADSSGGLIDGRGIAPAALLSHKQGGRGVAAFDGGQAGLPSPDVVAQAPADLMLEASPVNLQTGQPGLDCVRTAIGRGMGVVLANKGPLVHDYAGLSAAARAAGVGFAFSATVCGALPVVNIGQRDLAGCDIRSVMVRLDPRLEIVEHIGQGVADRGNPCLLHRRDRIQARCYDQSTASGGDIHLE